MPREIVIDTLAEHLTEGFTIHATCVPCWRHAQLDLAAFAARAPDASLGALHRRLRCSVCGSRDVKIIRIPYSPAKGGYGPAVYSGMDDGSGSPSDATDPP